MVFEFLNPENVDGYIAYLKKALFKISVADL